MPTIRAQRPQKTEKTSSENPRAIPAPIASPPASGMPRLARGPGTPMPNEYATAVGKWKNPLRSACFFPVRAGISPAVSFRGEGVANPRAGALSWRCLLCERARKGRVPFAAAQASAPGVLRRRPCARLAATTCRITRGNGIPASGASTRFLRTAFETVPKAAAGRGFHRRYRGEGHQRGAVRRIFSMSAVVE